MQRLKYTLRSRLDSHNLLGAKFAVDRAAGDERRSMA